MHLVLVGTAMFIAMLVPKLVNRASWVAAAASAGTAVLVAQVAPNIAILAGAAAGMLAAVVVDRREKSS